MRSSPRYRHWFTTSRRKGGNCHIGGHLLESGPTLPSRQMLEHQPVWRASPLEITIERELNGIFTPRRACLPYSDNVTRAALIGANATRSLGRVRSETIGAPRREDGRRVHPLQNRRSSDA